MSLVLEAGTVTVTLRLAPKLKARLVREAHEKGLSLNTYLVRLLEGKLKGMLC